MSSTIFAKEDQNYELAAYLEGKYLTFRLGVEEYGFQILKVRDIIELVDITAVPQMPCYIKGVINHRGKSVPVIDLRTKFSLPQVKYTRQSCIIIMDVGGMVGTIVDSVQEVADISSDQIEPPPIGNDVNNEFVLGLARFRKNVKILLDIDRVLEVDQWIQDLPQVENIFSAGSVN